MDKLMKLHFDDASILGLEDINSSFARGSLRVMYTGENPNGTYFSRETIEAALHTIRNVPIVAHYDKEENEIGSHDVEVVADNDGALHIRNLTEPCGVVPESAVASFSVGFDSEGIPHEFLTVSPVILWKRQEVYNHIVNDLNGKVDHSMEVNVTAFHKDMDSNVVVVDSFEFQALCLLEGAKPCFSGSELEVFSTDTFKAKMAEMLAELKDAVYTNECDTETYASSADKQVSKEASDGTDKYELSSNVLDTLCEALRVETVDTECGEFQKYWLEDFDSELNMVYACNFEDGNIYGFAYAFDGDKAVIDFANGKRMKRAFVEFNSGDDNESATNMFSDIKTKFVENDAQWREKYEAVFNELAQLKEDTADIDNLREYKANAEAAEIAAKRDLIFENFKDLEGLEAFDNLRSNCAEYDLETLEEKCYAIRGKNGFTAKFSTEEKSPKIMVVKTDRKVGPYGDLFEYYGVDRKD